LLIKHQVSQLIAEEKHKKERDRLSNLIASSVAELNDIKSVHMKNMELTIAKHTEENSSTYKKGFCHGGLAGTVGALFTAAVLIWKFFPGNQGPSNLPDEDPVKYGGTE
jgi:hypothetical protein